MKRADLPAPKRARIQAAQERDRLRAQEKRRDRLESKRIQNALLAAVTPKAPPKETE